MIQVKIFSSPFWEDIMNEWFEKNKDIEIVNIRSFVTPNGSEIIIFYKKNDY